MDPAIASIVAALLTAVATGAVTWVMRRREAQRAEAREQLVAARVLLDEVDENRQVSWFIENTAANDVVWPDAPFRSDAWHEHRTTIAAALTKDADGWRKATRYAQEVAAIERMRLEPPGFRMRRMGVDWRVIDDRARQAARATRLACEEVVRRLRRIEQQSLRTLAIDRAKWTGVDIIRQQSQKKEPAALAPAPAGGPPDPQS